MRRVRRHKRVVLLGVVFLMGTGVLSLVPRGLRGELFTPFPSRVLVQLQPLFPEQAWSIKNHPSRELTERLMDPDDPMGRDEIVAMINAVAEGSVFARAGSKRWARTSGRWIGGQTFRFGSKEAGWHYPDRTPADAALNDAFDRLMSILPEWDPRTRDRWPLGQLVTIRSGFEHPRWPTKGDLNERALLRFEGYEDIEIDGFIGHFDIMPLGEAGELIEGEIELSYYRVEVWDRDESEEPVKVERFPIRWRVVGSTSEAVEIYNDPTLLDPVKREIVRLAREEDYGELIMNDPFFESRVFEGLGMGLRVTLLDGETPIAEHHLRWMCRDGDVNQMSRSGDNFVPFSEVDARIEQAVSAGTLRVRVEGDPLQAMEIVDADRIWVGSFSMHYAEAVELDESAQKTAPPETTGP